MGTSPCAGLWSLGILQQEVRGLLGYLPFPGTDLLQVAAHEFGHVLGLQHTTAAKALMSPFYTFRYPLSLSPDDRRGIQHLYGRPRPAPTSKPPAVGPQPGVDTNEIAPLEVRPSSQLPSPSVVPIRALSKPFSPALAGSPAGCLRGHL